MRALILALALYAAPAAAEPASFASLFEQLVETDTTLATGSCTAAAKKMQAALAASGFPPGDARLYASPAHPEEGGLVAVLHGRDAKAGALLLVAHIDVVEADARDWRHPPFRLTKVDGYFYGRGVSDNKAVAAAVVDMLIRMRRDGFRPRRTIKVALTCGEESAQAFNAAGWLANEGRALIDADLALVPTAGAELDAQGRQRSIAVQAGEKVQQLFRIEASGTASHASRPTFDNAIYRLADALKRLTHVRFPVELGEVRRRQLSDEIPGADSADAAALRAFLDNPADTEAEAAVSRNPAWNALLRTTCAATMLESGRQANTIAPRAAATVNCRLLPGASVAQVRAVLERELAGPGISVTSLPPLSPTPPAPPLSPALLGAIGRIAEDMWPGVRVRPTLLTGATDARHLNAAGIPAYGVTVLFTDPDGNGVHAANERIRVRSVEEGRLFLHRLVTMLSGQPG